MNRILFVIGLLGIVLISSCSPKLVTTDSGIEYSVIKKNKKGKLIEKGDEVEAHCILTLNDGTKV